MIGRFTGPYGSQVIRAGLTDEQGKLSFIYRPLTCLGYAWSWNYVSSWCQCGIDPPFHVCVKGTCPLVDFSVWDPLVKEKKT